MILIENYTLAILFFILAMICWGSWANTQKLVQNNWRFELFYWDLAFGILLFATLSALTLGSWGDTGRPFLTDLSQANSSSILYAMLGGAIWNLGNILLVAAIAVAGMSVGFPIGGGLAWIVGILFNYVLVLMDKGHSEANSTLLFTGIGFIVVAIIFTMIAYRRLAAKTEKPTLRGILLSVFAGLLIAFFYGTLVSSVDNQFVSGGAGTLTPYSAVFFCGVGIFISTFIFNPLFMRYPVQGSRVRMNQYWKGTFKTHSMGAIGGMIWMLGLVFSFMAMGSTNPAISYALSNAAPVVAVLWGLFVWKEFKEAPKGTNIYLVLMFICYLIGLALITSSNT